MSKAYLPITIIALAAAFILISAVAIFDIIPLIVNLRQLGMVYVDYWVLPYGSLERLECDAAFLLSLTGVVMAARGVIADRPSRSVWVVLLVAGVFILAGSSALKFAAQDIVFYFWNVPNPTP